MRYSNFFFKFDSLTIICSLLVASIFLATEVRSEPDFAEMQANSKIKINVLANDGLGEDAKITYVSPAINGTARVVGNKLDQIEYIPFPNFIGIEQLAYRVHSSGGTEPDQTLRITVKGIAEGVTADQLADAAIVLMQALILAIAIEAGLHIVFTYRWYLYFLEGRGYKVPILIIIGLTLVNGFSFDLVAKLTTIFSDDAIVSNWVSKLLSALVLAGGTSTVYILYRTLGLRPPNSERNGSSLRRGEFARVKLIIDRGTDERNAAFGKDLEVFIDGALYGTIPKDKNVFPNWSVSSMPVSVDSSNIRVAVASDYSGELGWERTLKLSKLKQLDIYFDLKVAPHKTPSKERVER